MPRPFKCRRVGFSPETRFFKPAGIPVSELETIALTLDELESVRLADLGGDYQEDAAKKMNVSRQTFGNIVSSARKKIADALINGKAIRIEGGVVNLGERTFICAECANEWKLPGGTGHPETCPKCGSGRIMRQHEHSGCRRGHGRGRGNPEI